MCVCESANLYVYVSYLNLNWRAYLVVFTVKALHLLVQRRASRASLFLGLNFVLLEATVYL